MRRLSAKRELEIRQRSRQKRMEGIRCGPGSYPTDVDALLHEIKHLRTEHAADRREIEAMVDLLYSDRREE